MQYRPSEYGPVRDILFAPAETIESISTNLLSGRNSSCIMALCIDLNKMKGSAGKDNFIIMIRSDILLEDQLRYILLHEIGHIDWHYNTLLASRFKSNEQELYADFFAHETLRKRYGMDRAVDLSCLYGSAQGIRKPENAE